MTLSQDKIKAFKERIESEKTKLEGELNALGRDINNKGDWMATPGEQMGPVENADADESIQAGYVEEFEARVAEVDILEQQHEKMAQALQQIAKGTYGTCEVCKASIEEDRLTANPSAATCKAHMK